jgi:enediyne biosynthesis protein E4
VAVADMDHDGDPDAYVGQPFVNTLDTTRKGHWLQVRAIGNAGSNRAAIGTTIQVKAGSKAWIRHVQGGTGQGNQDSMYVHFGLGAADSADSVTLTFPGGKKVNYAGPFAADQRLWLFEDGTVKLGWKP